MRGNSRILKNDHGVALIIVLLITALLLALIFEFAYSTRISLRAAVNFRDSQRAYFLARSGINYCKKYIKDPQTIAPQGEWVVVPFVSTGDTEIRIKWEDEAGKINLYGMTKTDTRYQWVVELFSHLVVNPDIADKIVDPSNPKIQLITELHRYMSDEDYNKVAPFLTVNPHSRNEVNANTAAETVLRSILNTNTTLVNTLLSNRKDRKLTTEDVAGVNGLIVGSTGYRFYSYATVGGYTKQIEAIPYGAVFDYWKAL